MILWDVSLCLYFLPIIEDTVSFKFRGVCMCGYTGWLSVIFFILSLHVLGLF